MATRRHRIGICICLAAMVQSCGIFGAKDSVPEIPRVSLTLVGRVDSVKIGAIGAGRLEALATRGDTLLALGNGMLYAATPGQALRKVVGSKWQDGSGSSAGYDTSCPGSQIAFVGNRDSLIVANGEGQSWKIQSIGGSIEQWNSSSMNTMERAIWMGWVGSTVYHLLSNGWLEPAFGQAGTSFRPMNQGAGAAVVLHDTLFYGVGNGVLNDSIWAVSLQNLDRRLLSSSTVGGWLIACGESICLLDYHLHAELDKFQDGVWQKKFATPAAAYALKNGKGYFGEGITHGGMTIMKGAEGISIVRNDTLIIRMADSLWGGWEVNSSGLAIWADKLAVSGAFGAVYSLPLSELFNWK